MKPFSDNEKILVLFMLTFALLQGCGTTSVSSGNKECAPGKHRCGGSFNYQAEVCNDGGKWSLQEDCQLIGKTCLDGFCVPWGTDGDSDTLEFTDVSEDVEELPKELELDGLNEQEEDAPLEIEEEKLFEEADIPSETEYETKEQDISDGEAHASITWVSIPSGTFNMGCVPQDTNCAPREKPRHQVTIKKFEMTETEITQDQYAAVTGTRPSRYTSCGSDCPVEEVSWSEAKSFCEKIGGRLPSESEWEYAARAGTETIYYCGDDAECLDGISWNNDNSSGVIHPVKKKAPNAFGLYDMLGNAWEWIEDCFHEDYNGAPSTEAVWLGGDCANNRIVRGGSWLDHDTEYMRVSGRGGYYPSGGNGHAGFRCVWNTNPIDGDVETTEQDISDGAENLAITWITIPSGSFFMGCSPNDTKCLNNEKPRHQVNIRSFKMTKFEITQGQYLEATGSNPSQYLSCGSDCPVDYINGFDAKAFCEKIGGRLPSEAEWEYAARAGTTTTYYCGDDSSCLDDIAWYQSNSDTKTHKVGLKEPNAFGLHDMQGNVWEWVADWFHDGYTNAPTDGSAWMMPSSTNQVLRGGGFNHDKTNLRITQRSSGPPEIKYSDRGIRCAMDIPQPDGDLETTEQDISDGEIHANITWVTIPDGTFWMGCTQGETNCQTWETPRHQVTIKKFSLMKYEVTQEQFGAVMGNNPSYFYNCGPNCPVEQVLWSKAKTFCEKIGARLPTESEWEYAARAGKESVYYCGNNSTCLDGIAWYNQNSDNKTHQVGLKIPNEFGLYDMLGNVWEWTQDWFHWSYVDAPIDGSAWENPVGDGRVFRTGCWYDTPETLFLFHRARTLPDAVDFCGGFRCAMDIPQPDGDMETTEQDISDGEAHASITWVSIPSGSYMMGCSLNDAHCDNYEYPPHSVSVEPFFMTETEITQGQYKAVIGNNPSHFSSCGADCPVENVTWQQAKTFCEKIGGRLPSEAEWEYAARAGTTTAYYCGGDGLCLDDIAWFYLNSDGKTHAVKGKTANAFGLYDMSGNVWEWIEDCMHGDYTNAPSNGNVWTGGDCSQRMLRGGSWGSGTDYGLRSSHRGTDDPTLGAIDDGFRCAKDF